MTTNATKFDRLVNAATACHEAERELAVRINGRIHGDREGGSSNEGLDHALDDRDGHVALLDHEIRALGYASMSDRIAAATATLARLGWTIERVADTKRLTVATQHDGSGRLNRHEAAQLFADVTGTTLLSNDERTGVWTFL